MFKKLLVAAVLASMPIVATGCSKDAASGEEANSDKSPMDELKAIPEDLGKDVDAITQPIKDTDEVIKMLDELPKKTGMKASDLKVMAKATFESGEIKVSETVKPEAKEDVTLLLTKLKAIKEGFAAMPERIQALTAKLPATIIKIPVLVGKAQASLTVKANSPFGNADEKVKAKADLADLEKIKTDIMGKVEEMKKLVTEMPIKGKDAGVKLTAALSS